MMRRLVLFLPLFLGISFGFTCGAAASTMEFDGRRRTFEMYVPPTAPRPLPLVLLLHGGKGTAAQMRKYTGFDALAARENVLVAYPEGLGGHWNDGRPEIGNMDTQAASADDTAFLLALVDNLVSHGLADPSRVYVAGLSNGGMMALRLACTHPERIAGAAIVAANQPADIDCPATTAVPMIFFHGTDDRFIPYHGGDILQWANIDRGKVLSASDTVTQWLRIDGCTGEPKRQRLTDQGTRKSLRIERLTFAPCSGAPVEQIISRGGGHTWPGARQGPAGDAILGPAATAIDANAEIWNFFKSQPRR